LTTRTCGDKAALTPTEKLDDEEFLDGMKRDLIDPLLTDLSERVVGFTEMEFSTQMRSLQELARDEPRTGNELWFDISWATRFPVYSGKYLGIDFLGGRAAIELHNYALENEGYTELLLPFRVALLSLIVSKSVIIAGGTRAALGFVLGGERPKTKPYYCYVSPWLGNKKQHEGWNIRVRGYFPSDDRMQAAGAAIRNDNDVQDKLDAAELMRRRADSSNQVDLLVRFVNKLIEDDERTGKPTTWKYKQGKFEERFPNAKRYKTSKVFATAYHNGVKRRSRPVLDVHVTEHGIHRFVSDPDEAERYITGLFKDGSESGGNGLHKKQSSQGR
jgi:hypothetical protein